MNRKGLAIFPLIVIVAVGLVVIGAIFLLSQDHGSPVRPPIPTEPIGTPPPALNEPVVIPPANVPPPVACPQLAKQCPDGSYVTASGPNCEFASCPDSTGGKSLDCAGPEDTSCPSGYQCIQDCGPPVMRVGDSPPAYHCVTNDIAVRPRMCPICLASNTAIATPGGDMNVKVLKAGMSVWSLDERGQKIPSRIVRVSRTAVPPDHRVVHLVLSDGRAVWVSPGHPLTDGRLVGELRTGERYDGSEVTKAELVSYSDGFTYDLLPDSVTGFYWAGGIPLGSTLEVGSN